MNTDKSLELQALLTQRRQGAKAQRAEKGRSVIEMSQFFPGRVALLRRRTRGSASLPGQLFSTERCKGVKAQGKPEFIHVHPWHNA
jgi:hypothetical protein